MKLFPLLLVFSLSLSCNQLSMKSKMNDSLKDYPNAIDKSEDKKKVCAIINYWCRKVPYDIQGIINSFCFLPCKMRILRFLAKEVFFTEIDLYSKTKVQMNEEEMIEAHMGLEEECFYQMLFVSKDYPDTPLSMAFESELTSDGLYDDHSFLKNRILQSPEFIAFKSLSMNHYYPDLVGCIIDGIFYKLDPKVYKVARNKIKDGEALHMLYLRKREILLTNEDIYY